MERVTDRIDCIVRGACSLAELEYYDFITNSFVDVAHVLKELIKKVR